MEIPSEFTGRVQATAGHRSGSVSPGSAPRERGVMLLRIVVHSWKDSATPPEAAAITIDGDVSTTRGHGKWPDSWGGRSELPPSSRHCGTTADRCSQLVLHSLGEGGTCPPSRPPKLQRRRKPRRRRIAEKKSPALDKPLDTLGALSLSKRLGALRWSNGRSNGQAGAYRAHQTVEGKGSEIMVRSHDSI